MLSSLDNELVRRDRQIAGLSALFDPDEFVALLQTRLHGLAVEGARIEYVRYKPQTNCLVLYRLKALEKTLDVYAVAYGRGAVDKLEKARKHSSVASPFGSGRLIFDDESIVVSFFPNDSKIKTLLKLAEENSRKSLLRKLVSRNPEWRNGKMRGIRYKPERRYVTQLLVADEPRAVLKFYAAAEYNRAKIGGRAFRSQETLRLASEVGRSNSRHAIAFEWVGGHMLGDAYLDADFKNESIELVGRSLAELHAQQPSENLAQITRATERRTFGSVADGIGNICPGLRKHAESLAARLTAYLTNEPLLSTPIHGDFYANQVILGRESAGIIDLDEAARSDPAADLGNFIAHLEVECLRGRITAAQVESFSQNFLEGYRSSSGTGKRVNSAARINDRHIGIYTSIGLLRLAPQPFRDHEPNWDEKIEAILQRAEKTLPSTEQEKRTPQSAQLRPRQSPSNTESSVSVSDAFGIALDSKMPFLAAALEPQTVEFLFSKRLRHLSGAGAIIRLRAIRTIRHKPGRRALLEYDLEIERPGSNAEASTLIGKARAKGLDKTSFAVHQALWLDGFDDRSVDGVSVPKPIGVIPELQMWLQRRVPGKTAFLLLPEPDGIELAGRIAGAIYKLQQTKFPDAAAARHTHTITNELDILHQRLTELAKTRPKWRKRLERVLASCDLLGANLINTEQRTIHRDFYADQIIVSASRLYLIDFDLLCLGDPALDAGNFLAHITEQSLRECGDPAALRDREEAFEERYVELAGEDVRPSVRSYATLSLARHIYISTLFTERAKWTGRLLELCEERLEINRT
ncbi:MAG TPA: phosphotransferase [Pyrinomonadaceae bacterium]|nr:phosphotransferase [Pyrinomonadaceae bacterium]